MLADIAPVTQLMPPHALAWLGGGLGRTRGRKACKDPRQDAASAVREEDAGQVAEGGDGDAFSAGLL